MRVGVDGKKFPFGREEGAIGILQAAANRGYDGVFFRSVVDVSPTLDSGYLAAVRDTADSLGLYLEMGVGKVNPYASPEQPEIRELGGGDYLRAMEMMVEASVAIGCRELWTSAGNYKHNLPGLYTIDRFRTDVDWPDQLVAIDKFMHKLAPVLRHHGARLNIENHEEITSFEVLRLIESAGDDVLGVTFDTANTVSRSENPVAAAHRLAPYTHLSHLRDIVLFYDAGGLTRQVRPCGQGVIDWEQVIGALHAANPELNLSIEMTNDRLLMGVQIFHPIWEQAHPDLTTTELAAVMRLAVECEERARSGAMPSLADYHAQPFGLVEKGAFLEESVAYVRQILAKIDA
ncbi:sugar phosphate isomerase/epimerase family protein [Kribbella sp. HUAS MG21]|uniref:Sugar phosphate isomerase/epimerase family protein n=1 Tax=Kribbella sp. HUAS MG21 TaxID=3160966 RepID=A0AAU7T6G8_9ACTN